MDDAQLRTIWQQRQFNYQPTCLSESLTILMKHKLAKRVRQVGQLAQIWDDVIPESIRDHTALESYQSGILTVMVDSASHRFQLQTMLTGGVMKAIQERFNAALNKIRLIPGQFYAIDLETGHRRYEV